MNQTLPLKIVTPKSRITLELNEEVEMSSILFRIGIAIGLAYTLVKVLSVDPIDEPASDLTQESIEVYKLTFQDN